MKISDDFFHLRVGRRDQPAGILALDTLPQPPDPRLRPFVWCRHHANRAASPAARPEVRRFPLLMVGLAGNGANGDASANGTS